LFVVVAVFVAVFAAQATASDVVVITDDTWEQVLSENPVALVEFYAPWCGHCKTLAPEYEILATEFKDEDVLIAKVDCTENEAIAQAQGVRGFPTLKFFKGDAVFEYQGERTAAALSAWIRKRSGPPAVTLTSETFEEFTAAVESNPVVVGFFGDEHAEELVHFNKFAEAEETLAVGVVTDSALFGEVTAPAVKVFRSFADAALIETVNEELANHVASYSLPDLTELDPSAFPRYIAAPQPFALFAFPYDSEDKDAILADLEQAAKETSGTFRWVYGDSAQFGSALARFGASGEVFPTALAWYTDAKGEIAVVAFNEEDTLVVSELGRWAKSVIDGTVKPFRKSEAIPESNDEAVKVIVGKTFDELVTNRQTNILVEFYAPWCGHCKSLAPIYDELAEAFAGNDQVIIAKIDATANYVPPELGIAGFPTLIWFPVGGEPVNYSEGRDLDSFKSFIEARLSGSTAHAEKDEL